MRKSEFYPVLHGRYWFSVKILATNLAIVGDEG